MQKLYTTKKVAVLSSLFLVSIIVGCTSPDQAGIDNTNDGLPDNQTTGVTITPTTPVMMEDNNAAGGGGETTVSIADIMENPESYMGLPVTISSSIDEVYSDRVFSVEGATPTSSDLLIVSQNSVPNLEDELIGDDTYLISGTITELNIPDIEESFDIDFDPEVEAELEQTIYLDATDVQLVEE